MSLFFDAFWPNLAATLLGVMLGIPIALFINRYFVEHQRKFESDQNKQRLSDAIEVLMGACQYNIKVLDSMRECSLVRRVMHNPDLRITTWDAVGGVLASSCPDPELLQMLSHHWLRLHRIQALSDEIFSREVAGSLPAIEDKDVAREFWQVLHDNARDLAAHASEAVEKLDRLSVPMGMPANAKSASFEATCSKCRAGASTPR